MTTLRMAPHVAPIKESLSAARMGATKSLPARVATKVPHMAHHVATNRESLSAARMDAMKGFFTRVATQVDAQVAALQEILVASVANVLTTVLLVGVAFPGVEIGGNYSLVFCCW